MGLCEIFFAVNKGVFVLFCLWAGKGNCSGVGLGFGVNGQYQLKCTPADLGHQLQKPSHFFCCGSMSHIAHHEYVVWWTFTHWRTVFGVSVAQVTSSSATLLPTKWPSDEAEYLTAIMKECWILESTLRPGSCSALCPLTLHMYVWAKVREGLSGFLLGRWWKCLRLPSSRDDASRLNNRRHIYEIPKEWTISPHQDAWVVVLECMPDVILEHNIEHSEWTGETLSTCMLIVP